MRFRLRPMLALSLAALPAMSAHGQEEAPPDPAALHALEAEVPPQSWYPDGYYDVRIAAESEAAEMSGADRTLVRSEGSSGGQGDVYRIDDCAPPRVDSDVGDPVALRHGGTALEVARLHSTFDRLQYSPAIYRDALLAFERDSLERDSGATMARDKLYAALAKAVEAKRARLAPDLPRVRSMGCAPRGRTLHTRDSGPPPPPPGVILTTQPGAGEIFLINAFAFKVCMRKQPDPWDRFKCRWNEFEAGIGQPLSGRYVYQIRWPDGAVRKGTRELAPQGIATFKKTGS